MKNRIEVLFDEKGLEGFQVKWVFDEMFTAMVLDDILGGVKGPLSPENVAEIKKTVFDYLREYDYYT